MQKGCAAALASPSLVASRGPSARPACGPHSGTPSPRPRPRLSPLPPSPSSAPPLVATPSAFASPPLYHPASASHFVLSTFASLPPFLLFLCPRFVVERFLPRWVSRFRFGFAIARDNGPQRPRGPEGDCGREAGRAEGARIEVENRESTEVEDSVERTVPSGDV